MTRTLVWALGMLAVLAVLPAAADACSCAPMTLEERFQTANVVFVATIMESGVDAPPNEKTSGRDGRRVKVLAKFRIDAQLKGDASQVRALETELYLPDPGVRETIVSSCDVGAFVPGEQWVVFATADATTVAVSACSATHRLKSFRELDELDALRESKRPAAQRVIPSPSPASNPSPAR